MAATSAPAVVDHALGEAIQRQLFDKSEAKRREASAAVNARVRDLLKRGAEAEIRGLLQSLSTSMIDGTTDAAVRIGGLLGISAVGAALGSNVRGYLNEIVGAIMAGMDDDREQVRFSACEAIFNVAKVARAALLRPDLFRLIFVGMLNVAGDSAEGDVRGGAWMLSTALLEIATSQGDAFELPVFLDLFASYGKVHNPHTRQVLLAWLLQLDLVPGIDVGDHLPQFLAPLLHMLQDPNGEVRGEAHRVLAHFLKQVQSLEAGQLATRVDLAALVAILTEHSAAPHDFTRMMVFDWLVAVVRCAGASLASLFPSLTGAILRGVADEHQTVMTTAMVVNQELTRLVRFTGGELPFDEVAAQVLTALQSGQPLTRRTGLAWVSMLLDRDAAALMRLSSEFLAQLLDNITAECDDDELSLHVQVLALMSRCEDREPGARAGGAHPFGDRMLAEVLELLRDAANSLLERRGSYLLRHLCVVMDPVRVYRVLARQLWLIETGTEDNETEAGDSAAAAASAATPQPSESTGDAESAEFAYVVVEMLSLVLMTAPELAPLRARLQPSIQAGFVPAVAGFAKLGADHTPEASGAIFAELFRTWSCNPISSLLLALMAEQYGIANCIVKSLAAEPITVATLMQLDRGVQLLESPCFIQLRLHLCDPAHPGHAHLLSAMYGVLMVLPQSTAFHTLRDRLTSVSSLHIGLAMTAQLAAGRTTTQAASTALPASASIPVDTAAMLSMYTEAQRRRSFRTVVGDAEGAARDGVLPGWETLGGAPASRAAHTEELAPMVPVQLGQLTTAAKQAGGRSAATHGGNATG